MCGLDNCALHNSRRHHLPRLWQESLRLELWGIRPAQPYVAALSRVKWCIWDILPRTWQKLMLRGEQDWVGVREEHWEIRQPVFVCFIIWERTIWAYFHGKENFAWCSPGFLEELFIVPLFFLLFLARTTYYMVTLSRRTLGQGEAKNVR